MLPATPFIMQNTFIPKPHNIRTPRHADMLVKEQKEKK